MQPDTKKTPFFSTVPYDCQMFGTSMRAEGSSSVTSCGMFYFDQDSLESVWKVEKTFC